MRLALDSVTRCAAAWQRERSDNVPERARADAIAAPLRRAQFLAGRWLAAQLLAQHGGGPASRWLVTSTSGEAPRVLDGPGAARPMLSIAHRGDTLACAVADVPIGVDLELIGGLKGAADERAAFVLAPSERAAYAHAAAPDREAFLLARWVLKEAWAKRSGRGLMLGDMPGLAASPTSEGGNACLWAAHGMVVALCADSPGPWPPPHGLDFDAVPPQRWAVGPAACTH